MTSEPVSIPWDSLEPDTLERLLSEIVTRDGTDYGAVETPTETRINRALKDLQWGRASLFWDPETETTALLPTDQVREIEREYEKIKASVGIDSSDPEPQ